MADTAVALMAEKAYRSRADCPDTMLVGILSEQLDYSGHGSFKGVA